MRRLTKRERILKRRTLVPVTLWLDSDVLEYFRATGKGWETRINDALRKAIREELHPA